MACLLAQSYPLLYVIMDACLRNPTQYVYDHIDFFLGLVDWTNEDWRLTQLAKCLVLPKILYDEFFLKNVQKIKKIENFDFFFKKI